MKEEATMEGSESQILNPLEAWSRASSTEVSWPMKAEVPINEGYLLEASSREHIKSISAGSVSKARDEDDGVRADS